MDKIAEIKRLYLHATRATIERDLARAITLLKSIESEEERERAAAYMDGLAEMRAEWSRAEVPVRQKPQGSAKAEAPPRPKPPGTGKTRAQ
jgi:hypothetical protein